MSILKMCLPKKMNYHSNNFIFRQKFIELIY